MQSRLTFGPSQLLEHSSEFAFIYHNSPTVLLTSSDSLITLVQIKQLESSAANSTKYMAHTIILVLPGFIPIYQ